jgi:hypothetical protein
MDVTLQLATGDRLTLADEDASRLYDALWSSTSEMRGAVSAAGKLCHAQRSDRQVPLLDEHESEAVREALSRIGDQAA